MSPFLVAQCQPQIIVLLFGNAEDFLHFLYSLTGEIALGFLLFELLIQFEQLCFELVNETLLGLKFLSDLCRSKT